MGIKKIRYTNSLGVSIDFDNKKLFCENMDLTGMPGTFSVDAFAYTNGQITTSRSIGGRTIPCSFALVDRNDDESLRNKLAAAFSPLLTGTLRIQTGNDMHGNVYEIDVYSSAVPVFKRDSGVWYVWRWDVNFVADYPFFRKHRPNIVRLSERETVVASYSTIDVPIKITFPQTAQFRNVTTGTGFNVRAAEGHPFPITVDTAAFTITDSNGDDAGSAVSISDDISRVLLIPGNNTIQCDWNDHTDPVVLEYPELSLGVF